MRKKTAKARTDGQATRQALVDAAGILAARHGWASVRAKDVCKLAGVSAASVNYWFGSRDELYREVVRQIPEGLIDGKLEEYFQSNAEPLEKVRRVLETFLMASRGRGIMGTGSVYGTVGRIYSRGTCKRHQTCDVHSSDYCGVFGNSR